MRERHLVVYVGLAAVAGALLIGSHGLGFAAERSGGSQRRVAVARPATQPATQPASSRPASEAKAEFVAYYFHRTLRCPSCMHIEAVAKKTIQERFAAELKSGLLRWEDVDMQKRGNEHFVKDYKLSAPSLVLVKMVDGRQVSWKNCEKVWQLHRNEPAYEKYVYGEVQAMLSGKGPATQPARAVAPLAGVRKAVPK